MQNTQGQLFNMGFRSDNQVIIEEAIEGSFVKVVQSYVLCDTLSNERFGREGNAYFSQIPYIGIETSEGLIFPLNFISPWEDDADFQKYAEKYKPIISDTSFEANDLPYSSRENLPSILNSENTKIIDEFVCFNDSSYSNVGLQFDTLPGNKNGWLVWITVPQNRDINKNVKLLSLKKDIEISEEASPIIIESPKIEDDIIGGIFIMPIQTKIGQINILISGLLSQKDNEWILSFPFVEKPKKEEKNLTPVKKREGLNILKPKIPKK